MSNALCKGFFAAEPENELKSIKVTITQRGDNGALVFGYNPEFQTTFAIGLVYVAHEQRGTKYMNRLNGNVYEDVTFCTYVDNVQSYVQEIFGLDIEFYVPCSQAIALKNDGPARPRTMTQHTNLSENVACKPKLQTTHKTIKHSDHKKKKKLNIQQNKPDKDQEICTLREISQQAHSQTVGQVHVTVLQNDYLHTTGIKGLTLGQTTNMTCFPLRTMN